MPESFSVMRADEPSAPRPPAHAPTLRVAFFNRTRVFGGAEESLLANAKEFLRRGLEVVVICSLDGVVAGRLSEAGLKVRRLLPRNDFRARRHSLLRRVSDSIECRAKAKDSDLAMRVAELACRAETSRLLVALRELKPSVFFANMCVSADHSFLRCASRLGIPSVSHQQVTPVAWTGRRVVSEANAMCEWFVSNSEWTRRAWVNSGLRSERHEVAYNMIVKPPPANESLRDRLSLGRDSKLIVSVGRLDPTKKFDDGIRAFAEVAPRFPGWHYVIIGDGEERTRLGQLASVSGAGERIHFPGWLLRADSYLEQIDVLLHPTPAEHFGRVVAEAMLAGATALGHASGGVTEMIDDGVTGHLFHDERSMRDCLEQAMAKGRNAEMEVRARQRIEKLCGPDNAEILTRLVVNTGGPRRLSPLQRKQI